ncbi:hypothetical protein AFM11_30170 [Mycolicibacterium wolinskyi]|uniref:Lsr2 DNA-binding domain-containing protein n=1 Tax=Mycolicibacterium wolinskyi TaxID=59750 RepID=A0A132PDN9_9MYCO|nr:hypothetical protein AFM11_30170 [Mycolicibacterium wolinskyi]
MSLNKLLAYAPPAKAAQAALVMARATLNEPDVPEKTQQIAQQLIELGEDDLAERIRIRREQAVAADLRAMLSGAETGQATTPADTDDEGDEGLAVDVVELQPLVATEDVHFETEPPVGESTKRPAAQGIRAEGLGRLNRASLDRQQSAAIRDWARRRGMRVSTRQQIPADVVDKFIRDHTP